MNAQYIGRLLVGVTIFLLACRAQKAPQSQSELVTPTHVVQDTDQVHGVESIEARLAICRGSRITALSLPSLHEQPVWDAGSFDDSPVIQALSGPDDMGRIAFIEDHFFGHAEAGQRHSLKIVNCDGTRERSVFTRPGSAMWSTTVIGNGAIGSHIALSPKGGRVAILTDTESKQMPGALLTLGRIEIWDINEDAPLEIGFEAMDTAVSWFPDGRKLAFVQLVALDELPTTAPGLEVFGSYGDYSWDEVPAVYLLDLNTGKSQFFHVGWMSMVSADGLAVFIGGWNIDLKLRWRRVDMIQRQVDQVKWPGEESTPLAFPTKNTVLYWEWITSHVTDASDQNDLDGFALQFAEIGSSASETVIRGLDRNALVSFGASQDSIPTNDKTGNR